MMHGCCSCCSPKSSTVEDGTRVKVHSGASTTFTDGTLSSVLRNFSPNDASTLTAPVTIEVACLGYHSDYVESSKLFRQFINSLCLGKDRFQTSTQLMTLFFKFHSHQHGQECHKKHLSSSKIDAMLADVCQLAFFDTCKKYENSLGEMVKLYRIKEGSINEENASEEIELGEIYDKYPAIFRYSKDKNSKISIKFGSLGFLEFVKVKKCVRFSNPILKYYLGSLHLSANLWLVLSETQGNNLKQFDLFTGWQLAMNSLPYSFEMVKFFFGLCNFDNEASSSSLMPLASDMKNERRQENRNHKRLENVMLQLFSNFHSHCLVTKYLMKHNSGVQNRTCDFDCVGGDIDLQIQLMEASYELQMAKAADFFITDVLHNESFYSTQSPIIHKKSSKIYYVMAMLGFLLRRGSNFCVLELTSLNIDGSHLCLLLEQMGGTCEKLSIEAIDLSFNENIHQRNGCELLGKLLTKCHYLLHLNLRNCAMNQVTVNEIFNGALMFTPLSYLDMSSNLLSDRGCRVLIRLLAVCHNLSTLIISNNQITVKSCSDIANFVKTSNLHAIDLSENDICNEGVKLVLQAACESEHLFEIQLKNTKITMDLFGPHSNIVAFLHNSNRPFDINVRGIIKVDAKLLTKVAKTLAGPRKNKSRSTFINYHHVFIFTFFSSSIFLFIAVNLIF